MDEVGRGPVAGPLVAAGVMLEADADLPGVTDSKRLSDSRRRRLLPLILDSCRSHFVAVVEHHEIDSIGMAEAIRTAFSKVGEGMGLAEDWCGLVLVDGLPIRSLGFRARFITKGDSRSLSIAAASILAKVSRDDIMIAADGLYPGYCFSRHKGYLTPQHRSSLLKLGPSPIHRRSFAPVRQMLDPRLDLQ
jgi:ribonuclease HII